MTGLRCKWMGRWTLVVAVVCLVGACDGGGTSEEPMSPADAAVFVPTADAGAERISGGPDERLPGDSDPVARLLGTVTRSAEIQEDGVGDLYVALFDANPVDLQATEPPLLVSQLRITALDLNEDEVSTGYVLEAIPPREEPYFVITFFDDNGTINEEEPGPDKGDLVSLDGLSAVEVILDSPGNFERDLVLNVVMPL